MAAIGLACLLLALGVPRVVAEFLALDARTVLWDAQDGAAVPVDRLAAAAEELAVAARWSGDGERETARGLLLLIRAEREAPGAGRDRLYGAAAAAFESAVAAAPGQPAAWAHLAWLREQRGDPDGAVAALRLSMLSGAVVPDLMAARLEMGLRLLPALDGETLDLLRRQIRLTWVIAPDVVAGLGARADVGPLVLEALDGLNENEMAHYLRLHGKR